MVAAPLPLLARKRSELAINAASFDGELKRWLDATTAENAPLEKHYSQMCAAVAVLGPAYERLAAGATGEKIELDDVTTVEAQLLDLHQVWNFFREKLVVRWVSWLRNPLEATDELAWACYEPALKHLAADAGREPPLVFPSATTSPFTVPRGATFPLLSAGDRTLGDDDLADALDTLPVPIIGVPWVHGDQLVSALMVCHEVGHDVESALGLSDDADGLIASAVTEPGRQEAWRQWRSEVFADVFGTLAGGPAFASTLIDFLAGEWRTVAGRRLSPPNFGRYPTRPLRVAVAICALEHLGFTDAASTLRADWSDAYPTHAMAEFEADVGTVVEALMSGPYRKLACGGLTSLLTFTDKMYERAETSANELAAGANPSAEDPRELFAAARLAFERTPNDYRLWSGAQRVVDTVRRLRQGGRRADEEAAAVIDRPARNARSIDRLTAVLSRTDGHREEGEDV